MSIFSENQLIELITETGIRLLQPPNSTPELLNLLDEMEFLLTKVGQAPPQLVQKALLIPMKALIADELFRHSDPDVRITIASCLNEITRITAPIQPYDDDKMREIFELIVSSFENLSCQFGRCYSKAVLILQSVARLRACVMMLDLDCDPLVTKMFELFQRSISPKHPHDVILAMVKIMSMMIEESDNVSTELVKVLLISIRRENQSVSPASWELSAKILEGCTDKLRPYILETVSSMGYCLEDYAPILLSICKPEPELKSIIVPNVNNDSSFLVNNEPSDNLSHRVPYVLALEAARTVDYLNAYGIGGTALKKRRKQNSQNHVEEPSGRHPMNDEPSGNLCHPPDYVQALEATESCQIAVIAEAEYVQALEAAESLCVNALETEGTASKEGRESKFQNLDEEVIGLECEHDHHSTADDDINENKEIVMMDSKSVQEEADGFENKQVHHSCVLGANKRKRGRPRKKDVEQQEFSGGSVTEDAFQSNDPFKNQWKQASLDEENLDEEAIGLDCEHDHQSTADGDISKNNETVKKEIDSKCVQEEADDFENKQVYHSGVLGANKRKRGRPRKKDVEHQEFSGGSVNKDEFQSNDPFQNQRKQASLDEEMSIKPPGNLSHSAESVQDMKAAESVQCALSTGGTVSKEGRSLESQNLEEEITGLECEQGHLGTADDGISKNIGTLRTDMDFDRVQEEAVGFDNKQLHNSSTLSDNKRKRGRPRKKDVKQQEFLGGSGNKCETGPSTEDKFRSNGCFQNERNRASSDDDQMNVKPRGNPSHSAESVQDLKAAESVQCVNAISTGGTVSKEGRSPESQNLDEEVTGLECEQGHQGTADDGISKNIGILGTDMDFERVKEDAVGVNNKQLHNSSTLGDNKRKRGRPRKKDVKQQEFSGGSGNKSEMSPSTEDKFQSNGCFQNKRNRLSSDNDVIETPLGRKSYKDLVGCRIKVWWPLDGRYYKGRITLFDASMKKHQVTYDDGDEEILSLRKERWEFI